MNMRKQLLTGIVILASTYSVATLAASGNIGSGALGTDNFAATAVGGGNPGVDGDGPGGLSASLRRVFFGGAELHYDTNGTLVNPDNVPFTGTLRNGNTYKDGKKV
jgi:hypothetical protein